MTTLPDDKRGDPSCVGVMRRPIIVCHLRRTSVVFERMKGLVVNPVMGQEKRMRLVLASTTSSVWVILAQSVF